MIPRGTGRSYGIRWGLETRVRDEAMGDGWTDGWTDGWADGWTEGRKDGRTEGRKDGTYSAGVKDSASAYVLCPCLTEQLCLSIWKGVGNTGRDLGRFQER